MGDRTLRAYSSTIIFESTLSEEGLEKALGRVREEITKQEGTAGDGKIMGKRTFARPMKKKHDGIYVKFDFQMDPSKMDVLKQRFKLNEDIFRVQIICADDK